MFSSRDIMPQPIPYQGSKRQIASKILTYFPLQTGRLVEPFAGSAAISIAAAARRRAKRFWLNDAHQPLIALWREMITRPEQISQAYRHLWHDQLGRERTYYDSVRSRFNASHHPADFLYVFARCV
jgi:DNA adenine methylase